MLDPLVQGILAYLESAEDRESNAHYRDDFRIAWLTVLNAARGESAPHFWATYKVLRVAPDQVWSMIEARRKFLLGAAYEHFFGESSPPKKPVQSVSLPRRDRAA